MKIHTIPMLIFSTLLYAINYVPNQEPRALAELANLY